MKLYPSATQTYIRESGHLNTPSSELDFRKIMRRLQHRFPDQNVEDFTPEQLTEFCLSRVDGDAPLAPNTIKKYKAVVVAMFDWLTWKKVIAVDPSLELKHSVRPKGGNVRIGRWLKPLEISNIWNAFDVSDLIQRRDRLIVLFSIVTGLRVIELEQVTWDKFTPDLWFIQDIVGKNRKPTTVKLSAQLRDELMAWKKLAWMGAKAVFPTASSKRVKRGTMGGYHFKFTFDWDKPLRGHGLRYAVQGAGTRIGVKLNPHDLRRTLAGLLKDQGTDLEVIQSALRHTNIATTVNYLKKDPSRGHEATSGLEFQL